MQKCVITILVFCFIVSSLSFTAARCVDPITLALEQILADITFEIVPCPTYPNVCPTCSDIYYDMPHQFGTCDPNIYVNPYDQYGQCEMLCDSSIYTNPMPYDQYGQCGLPCGPNICTNSLCDQYGQCEFDTCSVCSCNRDMMNPCSVCEDSLPLYICFENCGCSWDTPSASPYIYFPEVEYPMSAMDIRPYFYGSCWCS